MIKNSKGSIGLLIGAVGIVYGLYSQCKMNKVANKLNVAINDLDTGMVVDIPNTIIKTATEQAVNREVSQLAKEAAAEVSAEISTKMNKEIKQVIDAKFDSLSEQVATTLAEQVAKIDTEALSTKVTKRAEQKIVEKFDGALDGLVNEFNKDLKNAGKMYGAMTDAVLRRDFQKNMFFDFR